MEASSTRLHLLKTRVSPRSAPRIATLTPIAHLHGVRRSPGNLAALCEG